MGLSKLLAWSQGGSDLYAPAIAALSGALSSALAMNHNYIGTEHLLLGLARDDGVAADVLRDRGLSREIVAQGVEENLARYVDGRSAAKAPRKRTADQGLSVEEDSCGFQGKAKVAPPTRCVWGYACDGGPSIPEDLLIVTFASS